MKKPELLLPAGSLSKLKTAVLYGADAVYTGAPNLSLRAKTVFPLEEMAEGVSFARKNGKRIYLTINLFTHNKDIAALKGFLPAVKKLKPDGLIVSDPGVFQFLKEKLPKMPLHVSTQANVCSSLTAGFWQKLGAARCVLGREVSFKEALEIKKQCKGLDLEIFAHGAMCISYSGRCLMSSFMAQRSANRGACAHSCRWKYKAKLVLEEETRPGQLFTLEEDKLGSYVFNSKDLCLMPKLDKILKAGFSALKIEGRTKSDYYTAQTARIYRKAIDDYFAAPKKWSDAPYMKELLTLQNRGYTEGFFDGPPARSSQEHTNCASVSEWRNCGVVTACNNGMITLEIRHKLRQGDKIELLTPYRFEPYKVKLDRITLKNGQSPAEISPGTAGQAIKFSVPAKDAGLFPPLTAARIKI